MAKKISFMLLIMMLSAVLVGCGPSTGSVSGVVTIKGKPLNIGTVTFQNSEGSVSAEIDSDGKYSISNAFAGPSKISIIVPAPAVAMEGFETTPAQLNPVPIPKKYAATETSGLTIDVKSGGQTHDITLE